MQTAAHGRPLRTSHSPGRSRSLLLPCFSFLPAGQLLPGGVVFPLLRCCRRLIVVIKRLLPMSFPVRVDFLHQFLRIVLGRHRHLLFYLLLCIGICLNVGPVNEYRFGRQISPATSSSIHAKDLVHRFCCKSGVGNYNSPWRNAAFPLGVYIQKPTVADICADLIRCPPQVTGSVGQMLDQNHLEQHNRGPHSGSPVIPARANETPPFHRAG